MVIQGQPQSMAHARYFITFFPRIAAMVVILALQFPIASSAETNEMIMAIQTTTNQPSRITEPPASDSFFSSNRWERWHGIWSSNITDSAEYLDRFFGTPGIIPENNDTYIKLKLGIQFREEQNDKTITRVSIRLRLPHTSNKLRLVFEDIVDSEDPSGTQPIINDTGSNTSDASLRYIIKKKKRLRMDADVGARSGSPVQLFVRLRARRTYEVSDNWELRLTERVTWFTDDGWVSKTEMQWDRKLAQDWLLRFNSELEWREDRDGVRPAQQISLFKTFSRRRALRFDVGGSWPEYPNIVERIYYTSVTHRRLIHSDWLFLEIKPGVEFPEIDDYDSRFYFKFQFEMIIGRVR